MPSHGFLGSSFVLYYCYYLSAQKYHTKASTLKPQSYLSTWLLWIWNPPRIWLWDSGEIISHKVAIICQSKLQTLKTIPELEGPPPNEVHVQVDACLGGPPGVSRVSMTQHLAIPRAGT